MSFEFIDECAVDEHVEQGQEFVRDLAAVAAAVFQHISLQGGAGIAPDVLFGVYFAHAVQKRHQSALILRLEGLAAEQQLSRR